MTQLVRHEPRSLWPHRFLPIVGFDVQLEGRCRDCLRRRAGHLTQREYREAQRQLAMIVR